jgi:hypothetical protein
MRIRFASNACIRTASARVRRPPVADAGDRLVEDGLLERVEGVLAEDHRLSLLVQDRASDRTFVFSRESARIRSLSSP